MQPDNVVVGTGLLTVIGAAGYGIYFAVTNPGVVIPHLMYVAIFLGSVAAMGMFFLLTDMLGGMFIKGFLRKIKTIKDRR